MKRKLQYLNKEIDDILAEKFPREKRENIR